MAPPSPRHRAARAAPRAVAPSDRAARTWRELLRRERVFALATAHGGASWSAPLFFAADRAGTTLFFVSSPASRHSREARGEVACAGSLWTAPRGLPGLRGAQFEGRVRALAGAAADAARRCFLARHPAAAPRLAQATGERLYAFAIGRVKVTDNRVAFGWKFVLDATDLGLGRAAARAGRRPLTRR